MGLTWYPAVSEWFQGLWFKYCLWTFCLCWKGLATSSSALPKTWIAAAPHSSISNCLFSPQEISINPVKELLLTHHIPLPSLCFALLYETSNCAWYRACSSSKSLSIIQCQLVWMHVQPHLLQTVLLYADIYKEVSSAYTKCVKQSMTFSSVNWPLGLYLTQDLGSGWKPDSLIDKIYL